MDFLGRKLGSCQKSGDEAYSQGQIQSAKFFIETVLPVSQGRMDSILSGCSAAVDIDGSSF